MSNENDGNHLGLIVFDEPGQQSIENKDLFHFISDIINNYEQSQIIVAITLNNSQLEEYVKNLDNVNTILITDKAIKPIR